MNKLRAVIIGDTRYFHIGSHINCIYLSKVIETRYILLGLFGGDDFYFNTYDHFLEKIKSFDTLYKNLEESDVVFFNGEGYIEPNSRYAEALFYLAKYIKEKWPTKKSYLINFSCFDVQYGDWKLFDKLIPRDEGSFNCLKPVYKNIQLGFDCCILQDVSNTAYKEQNLVLVFRGRRDIAKYELERIQKSFNTKKVIPVSTFWKFDHNKPRNTESLISLQRLLQQAYLIVSSSFHGLIFSMRFGIPFIPVETISTKKNTSVSSDVLDLYYKQMDLSGWLEFYKDQNNYDRVKRHLAESLPQLQKRAFIYSQ